MPHIRRAGLQNVDSRCPATHLGHVLRLLRHLLCLGILVGLAGNGVAIAAPCAFMDQTQSVATAKMPDCQMGTSCSDCGLKSANSKNDKTKGMKPGCMMMAGCTAVIGMKVPSVAPAAAQSPMSNSFWPLATHLTGRVDAPEPEPPTLLS